MKMRLVFKGGKGSGNFGHAGRPGKVGGSAGSGGSSGSGGASFEKGPNNTFTKKLGNKTVTVKFGTKTTSMEGIGRKRTKVGETATISVHDPDLPFGVTHESIRLDTFSTGKKLDRAKIFDIANKYLHHIASGKSWKDWKTNY
jgi:hypothetical protein